MPIVNTVAVRLEAFEAGFRQGIEAASRSSAAFEKRLSDMADKLGAAQNRISDLERKLRGAKPAAEQMGGAFGRLTNGVEKFSDTISKSRTPLTNFIQQNRTIGDVFRNLIGFIGGLNPVVAASIAAIGLLTAALIKTVRQGVALGDEFNAVSRRTRFSTEALSQLKFVVEQNESSFETLQFGLRNFNRNLGAALQGSSQAIKLFKQLGVSQDELKRSSPEEVFNKVSDGLKDVGSSAVQTSLGLKLFGRGSSTLIPVIAQGSEALARQRKEAEELGFTISGRFAAQADDFGDTLGKLRTLQQGLSVQIAQAMIPALNSFLVTVIPLAKDAIPLFAASLSGLAFIMSKVDAVTTQTIAQLSVLRAILTLDIEGVKFFAHEADVAGKVLLQTKEEFDKATQAALANVPATRQVGEEMAELEARIEQLGKELAKEFAHLAGQPEPLAQSLIQVAEKFAALGPKGIPALRGIRDQLVVLNEEGAKTDETFEDAIKRIDQLIGQATPLAGLINTFTRLQEGLEGGSKAATSLATNLLEIGSPRALAQYDALIVKLTKLAAAGDKAAERAVRPLLAAEGPVITPEQRAGREQLGFQPAEAGAIGAEGQLQVGPARPSDELLGARALEREEAEFVGPRTPDEEGFIAVQTAVGEINVLFEEQAEEIGRINELAVGFGDTLVDAALGAKGAFGDFFKGLAIQLAKAIARALVLASLLSLTGLGGGLKFGQLFKKGLNFDDPGADSFALAEGRRFGMLFGRGARVGSEGNRLGIAGNAIAQAPTVSPVTNVNVYEPGPLTNITFTDKAVIPRLRQRLRTLGEEPFTR